MLETCFRRFFYSGLDQHRKKTEAFTDRIIKLTNRIEQQMSDYDMLLNGVDTMIWLNYEPDIQGKSNKAVLDFFGTTAEELEGKNLHDLMPPDEAEFCIKTNKEIFKTGKSKTTYEWVTRYDGEKRLLKINKRPKKNGVHYIVCSAEDITELEETRNQLQKECNFSESLIQTAQAVILVLDIEAKIVRCNKYFEEISGYSFEEIEGKNWFDIFVNEADRSGLESLFKSYLHEAEKENSFNKGIINPIRTKDGNTILIEWFSQPLTDNLNAAIGIVSVGQDVTDKKTIEEALWAKIIELEIKLKASSFEETGALLQEKNKGTETILIVDDERTVLDILSMILQQHGYTVLEAFSSKEAEEVLQVNSNIDLLITDFYLADLNGYQLVKLARQTIPGIEYLIISGLEPSTPTVIPDAHFFKKPFLLDDFMDKVREVLDSKQ